jgi:hypothetical protein
LLGYKHGKNQGAQQSNRVIKPYPAAHAAACRVLDPVLSTVQVLQDRLHPDGAGGVYLTQDRAPHPSCIGKQAAGNARPSLVRGNEQLKGEYS